MSPKFVGEKTEESKQNLSAQCIRGTTERIKKSLKPIDFNLLKNTNSHMNNVCRIKDKRSSKNKKNVVYKTKCNDCEKVFAQRRNYFWNMRGK